MTSIFTAAEFHLRRFGATTDDADKRAYRLISQAVRQFMQGGDA